MTSTTNKLSGAGDTGPAKTRSRQNSGFACQQCRLRKLRCDRLLPCGVCVDAGIECRIEPTNPQRGPKRGHLKEIRQRIAALERHVAKENDGGYSLKSLPDPSGVITFDVDADYHSNSGGGSPPSPAAGLSPDDIFVPEQLHLNSPPLLAPTQSSTAEESNNMCKDSDLRKPTAEEDAQSISPLTRADLDQLYFDRVHMFIPILQRGRYIRSSRPALGLTGSSPASQSHTCLQYAIWAMAASMSSQFQHLRSMLYHEALQRLTALELSYSPVEDDVNRLEQTQAWILVAIYELMQVGFRRAWASAGRAIRLVQLMRLNNVDSGIDVAISAADIDSDSFVEKEAKRRTFWITLCLDRFSCVLHGLPLTLCDEGILTRLPCSDEAFQNGTPVVMPFLSDAMDSSNHCRLLSFNEFIIFTTLWGRVLVHKKQAKTDHVYGMSQEFYERQMVLDGMLTHRISHLQQNYLASSLCADSMLLLTAMVAQSALLSLWKAAETIPATCTEYGSRVADFWIRTTEAVKEIARLSKFLQTHFGVFKVHPLTPISLFLCQQTLLDMQYRDDSLEDDLKTINEALRELETVNRLSQNCLDISLAEVEAPPLLPLSDPMLDFFQ